MSFNFSSTAGTSGITTITISATSNSSFDSLVDNFTLSNSNGHSMLMAVAQRAYEPLTKYINFQPSSIVWDSSGGTGSIRISSNDDWVITSDGWITLSRLDDSRANVNILSGNGNTIVGIRCGENTGSTRNGSITGYCVSDTAVTASTVVSQNGNYVAPYIIVDREYMAAYSGETVTVGVSANTTWNTITNERWIDLQTQSGSGNGNITFIVYPNISDFNRSAEITVFNYEQDIYSTLVVLQPKNSTIPYITLNPVSFVVAASGTSGNVISVSANCDYNIESDVQWITLDASSGSGNGSVSFTTATNSGASDAGNIVFSNSATSNSVTVQRKEVSKYLSASTSSFVFDLNSHEDEISVYSNVEWGVLVQEDSDLLSRWISVSPTSGEGNGTIRISVESAATGRYATILLVNSNYGLSWEITVKQVNKRVITYTSTNNSVVTPTNFPNIVSNTYENGVGTIVCSEDITEIPVSAFAISWSATTPSRLLTITIPESVERLNDFAFYNCTNLESANIPNSVTGIGRTFNMTNISAITIPHSVLELGGMGFAGCPLREIVLPNSLRSTGSYNFGGDPLVSVTIENGITELGAGNFGGCNLLPLIEIPNSVATIHERCFNDCTSLSAITIGTGMTEMRDSCFSGCSSLAVIYCHAVNAPILNGQDYSPYSHETFSDTPSNVVVHIPRGSSYQSWRSDTWAGRWTYIDDL